MRRKASSYGHRTEQPRRLRTDRELHRGQRGEPGRAAEPARRLPDELRHPDRHADRAVAGRVPDRPQQPADRAAELVQLPHLGAVRRGVQRAEHLPPCAA